MPRARGKHRDRPRQARTADRPPGDAPPAVIRPAEGDQAGRRKRIVLAAGALVVCAAVLAAHWPALSAKALCSDDLEYVVYNPLVTHPSWESASRFLTEVLHPSTVGGYYQPISMISLMLDYAAGATELDPTAFHRTSLALHVANSVLVVLLIYLLFGNPFVAAMAGLLFGLHPMTVEPIPWISERKTLLASLFALACLVLYVRYARLAGANPRQPRAGKWCCYFLALAAFVMALMSKPTSTPLPVCLLLLDYWPLRRLKARAIWEKLPFLAVAAVSAYITFQSQKTTFGVETERGPLWIVLILCHNVVFYLHKIILPVNLSPHYPYPDPVGLTQPAVAAGVMGTSLLVLALVVLLWKGVPNPMRRVWGPKTPAPLVGWLFFFIAILPAMGVVGFTVVVASDKFAYLPSAGLLIALAGLLAWLWDRPGGKLRVAARVSLAAAVVAIAAAEAAGVRATVAHWRDTDTLNAHMLALTPGAAWVHNCTAVNLIRHGRFDEAEAHLHTAMRLKPEYAEPHNSMGYIYNVRGDVDGAIREYQQAVRLRSGYTDARRNLAQSLAEKERREATRPAQGR